MMGNHSPYMLISSQPTLTTAITVLNHPPNAPTTRRNCPLHSFSQGPTASPRMCVAPVPRQKLFEMRGPPDENLGAAKGGKQNTTIPTSLDRSWDPRSKWSQSLDGNPKNGGVDGGNCEWCDASSSRVGTKSSEVGTWRMNKRSLGGVENREWATALGRVGGRRVLVLKREASHVFGWGDGNKVGTWTREDWFRRAGCVCVSASLSRITPGKEEQNHAMRKHETTLT